MLLTAAAGSMADIMSNVGTITSTIVSTIGDFVDVIVGTPYLMIGVGLMITGAGVSFISRLIRA